MAKSRKVPAKAESTKMSASRVSKKQPATDHTLTKKPPAKRVKPSARMAGTQLTLARNTIPPDFIVRGDNLKLSSLLAIYRGEGMCLIAMNWKEGTPSNNFVGFAIEYQEPGGNQFFSVKNRIAFADPSGKPNAIPSPAAYRRCKRFRWIHFPRHAGIPGIFTYRVTPVFMGGDDVLSYGDFQEAGIELEAETYPGELNICFTRGFISSQAFVDNFGTNGGVGSIIPESKETSIDFKPTDPQAETALAWMWVLRLEAPFLCVGLGH